MSQRKKAFIPGFVDRWREQEPWIDRSPMRVRIRELVGGVSEDLNDAQLTVNLER
jgi:hypothetical protein